MVKPSTVQNQLLLMLQATMLLHLQVLVVVWRFLQAVVVVF
jgi:hypothetical protein